MTTHCVKILQRTRRRPHEHQQHDKNQGIYYVGVVKAKSKETVATVVNSTSKEQFSQKLTDNQPSDRELLNLNLVMSTMHVR